FPLLFPFIFTHAATTELYTLSLHDALPIYWLPALVATAAREAQAGSLSAWSNDGEICSFPRFCEASPVPADPGETQRAAAAATRSEEHTSNSSHVKISYAVFCLKKKKKRET